MRNVFDATFALHDVIVPVPGEGPDGMTPDGTQGYADEADALIRQYESIPFNDVHASVLHLIPTVPGSVLDIGSGTGRDAASFATMGHRVTAVEPSEALRTAAKTLHPSPLIDWLDDTLPDLPRLTGCEETFDVVMLTAVWMHLDEAQRRLAMPRVGSLVRQGGVMILSLRQGPVPPGRRMFDVTADETILLAGAEGLTSALRLDSQDGLLRRPGVSWTRLAFLKPL
jgi:SAM-dependent methyltransferase